MKTIVVNHTKWAGVSTPQNSIKLHHPNQTGAIIDPDKLEFPVYLADIIGLRKETISYWKKLGCKFVGRKTTVRWVRQYMDSISGGNDHGIA